MKNFLLRALTIRSARNDEQEDELNLLRGLRDSTQAGPMAATLSN